MICASVIICTHNPRPHYLSRVLEGLRNQTLPFECWELLLIDNASKDPLTSKSPDISWHPHGRLVREEELGLTSARMRGMREASAGLLVFVDDDNILDLNYLSEAVKINDEWPRLGVWGAGSITPEFEVEPAQYLKEFLDNLALREIDSCRWTNVIPCDGAKPWGAGQCVRSNIAKAYCEHVGKSPVRISDRRGTDLASGGDIEIDYVACNIGFGVGVFPQLRLIYLIPAGRIEEDYLVRIAEGGLTSSFLLDFKWRQIVPASPFSGIGCLRVVRNVLQKKGIHRRMYFAWLRATLGARGIILGNGHSRRGRVDNGASTRLRRGIIQHFTPMRSKTRPDVERVRKLLRDQ